LNKREYNSVWSSR